MAVGPIILRELRVQARRRGLRRTRVLVALVTLLVTWTFFLGAASGGGRLPAQVALGLFGAILLWISALLGSSLTADAVSREYREQTLGFLLLSPLRGWEVALGKLLAHTLTTAYAILATVPVLTLPVLVGGATGGQVLGLALACLDVLGLGSAIALYFSSGTNNGKRALNLSMLVLVVLLIVLPVLSGWGSLRIRAAGGTAGTSAVWLSGLALVCPSTLLESVLTGTAVGRFTIAMGVQMGLAAVLVALAGRRIRRRSTERPATPRALGWQELWRQWRLGSPARRAAVRARWLEVNPFGWLSCRYRYRWVWPLLIAVLPLGTFLTGWILWPVVVDLTFALTTGLLLAHLLLKLQMASDSVTPLLEQRQGKAVELLAVTPLRNRDFLAGQWAAMRQQFGPAVVVTLGCTLWLALRWLPETPAAAWITLLVGANLLLDWWTLTWVGMWCATWRSNPRKAASNAGGFVLALPWLAWIVLWILGSLVELFAGIGPVLSADSALVLWWGLGWLNDLFWIVICRRILQRRLRVCLQPLPEQ